MLEVKNLVKRYGSKYAVDNISFTVNRGEILGFLGPNGAGKTTTMNIVTGYLSSTEGTATIDGHEILDDPLAAKAKIGYLPEHPPLYMDMTVKEYLNFMYDLKKVKLPRQKHIEQVCDTVKISHVYTRLIRNLSKGYKQRVGLAQALLGNPDLLILDEPTVGLDPSQIIEIRNLIKDLGKKHTVILSSHILPEVQAICERVIVINDGKIIADDTPDHLSRSMSSDSGVSVRLEGPVTEVNTALRSLASVQSSNPLGEREKGVFEYVVTPRGDEDIRRDIFALAAEKNWPILSMKSTEMTLEEIFLKLVSGEYIPETAGADEPASAKKPEQKAAKKEAKTKKAPAAPAPEKTDAAPDVSAAQPEPEAPQSTEETGGDAQ